MVAADEHNAEGQDGDEHEKESKDRNNYCDEQFIRVHACVCELNKFVW